MKMVVSNRNILFQGRSVSFRECIAQDFWTNLLVNFISSKFQADCNPFWKTYLYTPTPRKLTWQWKITILIGSTSSNGCFSILICLFLGAVILISKGAFADCNYHSLPKNFDKNPSPHLTFAFLTNVSPMALAAPKSEGEDDGAQI